MFNRLPPELVRLIIESSVPSTNQRKIYHDRQATLCQLCLVCRLFREIAQPLLFEVVWIDRQSKLIALHKTLESEGPRGTIRQLIVEAKFNHDWDADLKRILRSCHSLRSLTLELEDSGPLDLSVLQDLPHLADLSLSALSDGDYQFPSSFQPLGLTSLIIEYVAIKVAPTLLNPVVLPSLRSLALIQVYDDHDIAYLNRSRLDELVPQLKVLFLESRIIQRGLDYLIPALSRTLFDFYPPPSDDRIDLLQVAQHLRVPHYPNLDHYLSGFAASIENQDRQISLRSVYLDISLRDLPSRQVDVFKAVQDLLRVCKDKGIEVIYEEQEVAFGGELRPSEEFSRRQREIRKLEATGK